MTQSRSHARGPSENTRSPRVKHGGDLSFKPKFNQATKGLVKDISETGIFIISKTLVKKGCELTLYLPLPLSNKKTLCLLTGKVVRVARSRRAPQFRGYGISLDPDTPESSRSILREFISMRLRGETPSDPLSRKLSPYRD